MEKVGSLHSTSQLYHNNSISNSSSSSNSSGPLDLDMFNLTSSSSGHHTTSSSIGTLNNTNNTFNNDSGDGRNMVVVGILIGLIILLCLFLAMVAVPPLYAIWRSRIPVNPKKIERRYRTIEGWLISKRIKEHDSNCDRIQRAYSEKCNQHQPQEQQPLQQQEEPTEEHPQLEECLSTDETVDSNGSVTCCVVECPCESSDEVGKEIDITVPSSVAIVEEHECPICMEAFQVGQAVSWSASTSCEHVFHHPCIKEWLLRHIHCPCCREIFLLVDCPQKKKFTMQDLQKLASERKKRYDQTYFCIKDGLVTLHGLSSTTPPPSSSSTTTTASSADGSRDELMSIVKSKTKSGVSKSILAGMRSTPALEPSTLSQPLSSTPPTNNNSTLLVESNNTSQQQSSMNTPTAAVSPANSSPRPQPQPPIIATAPSDEFLYPDDEEMATSTTGELGMETDATLRPSRSNVNASIVVSTTAVASPRIPKSIWRGLGDDEEDVHPTAPSSSASTSSSSNSSGRPQPLLLTDNLDLEEGIALVAHTDSFKENQTESPKVMKMKIATPTLGIMKGKQNGFSDASKGKKQQQQQQPLVIQSPFLSETFPHV